MYYGGGFEMTLKDLINEARYYRLAVVSGCQRSGTHIMAKILAHEMGWKYMTDNDYNPNDDNCWADLVMYSVDMAIQCPQMTHMLHLVPSDVLVVYMIRPMEEMEASFDRVNPGHDPASKSKQMLFYGKMPGVFGQQTARKWNAIRNMFWEGYQRIILDGRGYSFNYHDLEDHPLFHKDREGWAMNQTEPSIITRKARQ